MLLPFLRSTSLAAATPYVCENDLLNTLSAADFAALKPSLEYVDMPLRKTFSKGSRVIKRVFFPCSGMFSLIRELEDGSAIEVGLVGNEGFVGVPLLLGAPTSPLEALVQGAGQAIVMSAATFTRLTDDHPVFRKRLLLYAQCLHIQVMQTAACNGRHKVSQRLARWILETHDRIRKPELSLSHEFLSYMLGVRRAGISEALKAFTRQKLLTTGRGQVIIRDRKGIERVACECYRTIQLETKHLLAA